MPARTMRASARGAVAGLYARHARPRRHRAARRARRRRARGRRRRDPVPQQGGVGRDCAARRRTRSRALCAARGGLFIVNDDAELARRSRRRRRARRRRRRRHQRGARAPRARSAGRRVLLRRLAARAAGRRRRRRLRRVRQLFRVGDQAGRAPRGHLAARRARALGVPVVAIGGITAANAPALIAAGASASPSSRRLRARRSCGCRAAARRSRRCFGTSAHAGRPTFPATDGRRRDERCRAASRREFAPPRQRSGRIDRMSRKRGIIEPQRGALRARAALDSRRASIRRCARFARSAARRDSSRAARAPYLWDADGKRYIDYVGSWGPAILGHAHPGVVRAVQSTARARAVVRRADRSSRSSWRKR